jgi:glycerol uptake facilitator-like aquaporin
VITGAWPVSINILTSLISEVLGTFRLLFVTTMTVAEVKIKSNVENSVNFLIMFFLLKILNNMMYMINEVRTI